MTEGRKATANSLGMLNAFMFDEMERLSGIDPNTNKEELEAEIKRAKAMSDTAKVIVESAGKILEAAKMSEYSGSRIQMPKALEG